MCYHRMEGVFEMNVRVRSEIKALGRLMELLERYAAPLYKVGDRIHWKQAPMAQLVDDLEGAVAALTSLPHGASTDAVRQTMAVVCNAAFHLGTRQAICALDDAVSLDSIGGAGADAGVDN